MAQVHTIPARKVRGYQTSDEVMNTIRWRLYEHDAKDVALRAGVSVACIYAIRAGRTKWPRPATFFAILALVDVEMHLYDRRQSRYI